MKREELEAIGLGGEAAGRVLELWERDAGEKEAALRAGHDAQLEQIRREAAIECALLRAGAREPKTVVPLLDLRTVALEDGELRGLAPQLESVRERAGYLFGAADTGTARVDSGMAHGSAPAAGGGQTIGDALRDHYR